ncbi:MAG: DNA repair protein RecN [Candidatus Anaerobiospirillum merdipullorum]|uniref:DNA repair protein RecN n=1 Tax=Candidatus Anaerobiospirillum merdipullorum TaxID=2838450 RepID=A0A9E2KR70_9GAMM|nr:DNA repair protein RecN [Candidatus Anaerobiospirillum merdipullorum]
MLLELSAINVGLSAHSTLEFGLGLSCITGETGAGKSLTIDALSLALGGKASVSLIRDGATQAEAAALFAIGPKLKQKLKALDLTAENEDELVLRRVVKRDGKNKAYINGHLSTISLMKELAGDLISIHGQHASYKLLDASYQLALIDGFGALDAQVHEVQQCYARYQQERSHLNALAQAQKEGALRYKSLRYEKEILGRLNLNPGDYEDLVARFDKSMHAQKLQDAIALAESCLNSDERNVIDILQARLHDLSAVQSYEPQLSPIIADLNQALTLLDSVRADLSALLSNLPIDDPTELNARMTLCHDCARRFGVQPNELYALQEKVEQELNEFLSLRERIESTTAKVKAARQEYEQAAQVLSTARLAAAEKLSAEVSKLITTLAMPDGRFKIRLWTEEGVKPRAQGRDEVQFLFSANVGQELKDLGEVASGGELSRLALALEAVTASVRSTPTLIFDEVDTGISGRTASAVGQLLRRLGQSVQVLTVTHLPQVAACANTQYVAQKSSHDGNTASVIVKLDEAGRVEELARMMGGAVVTADTRASAASLLQLSTKS